MHSGRESDGPRVGIIVPRFKHSAVARNQVKRRLRELVRLQILPTGMLVDVVVRIRPEAYVASFDELSLDIRRLVIYLRRWLDTSDANKPEFRIKDSPTGDIS